VAGMSFQQKVWALTAPHSQGKGRHLRRSGRAAGSSAYRAVGNALHNNPYAPQVPCHRVVGSDGKLTGFAHGLDAKRRMLEDEGVKMVGAQVDMRRHRAMLAGK